MPKLFGTNILGILLGALAMWLFGSLWYGGIMNEAWLEVNNMTKEMAEAKLQETGMAKSLIGGFLLSLLSTIGLSYVLQQSGASLLATCAKICAIIAALVVLPIMGYSVLHEGYPVKGLMIDFTYVFIGFILAGAVMSFFRGKDAIDPT